MATGKPGINIGITADASGVQVALKQTEAALDKTSTAARDTAAAVQQINNTSKGLLEARAKVAQLQSELAKLKDAAVQSGTAMQRTVVQDYKKALSAARVVVAEEREKLAQAMANKPVVIPVKPQLVGANDKPVPPSQEQQRLSKELRRQNYLAGQLPAQFTDITVSLASGQNPLTVLLQQGGQLKDMYGGVGLALKGMAGYVIGLISPISVLTATFGVAFVAFAKGRQELQELNKALAVSGNAAGTTVEAMQDMARAIDGVTGTQGRATQVLSQLAESGYVGADALQGLAQAAMRLGSAGGPAVEETVAKFVELGKSPTEASRKLNQQLGYLNRATFEQIRALENAGRTAEAAALAQNAYRQAVEASADRINQRLGTLQKVAKATTGFFKELWDSILGIGREETLEQQMDKVEKRIADLQRIRAAGFNRAGGNDAELQAQLDKLETLKETQRLADRAAAKEAERVKKNRDEQRKSDIAFADRGEVALARANAELELVRASLSAANDAYKTAYDTGLVNLQQYYDARASIIATENAAELRELRAQLAQAQANLAKAPLEGRAAAQAAVIAAQGKVNAAGVAGPSRLAGNEAERAKAAREYATAIDALNLRLMENAAAENTAAASALRRTLAERQFAAQMGQATTGEQRASIQATIDAQVAAGDLAAAQADKERQLVALTQRRAQIEQGISQGKLNQVEGEEQLFALEQQRNELLVQLLRNMQEIPNLTVDQQAAIKQAIEASQLALQRMTPLMQQVTTTIRGGLEQTFTDALMNVRSLKDGLAVVGRQVAEIFARRAAASATNALFAAFGFAEGGHVRGPGSETSDSIPARLSNNEFVMPAKAVRNYGVGFMEAIRKMQVPKSAFSAPVTVPSAARYAEGGLVSAAATAQPAGMAPPSFPVNVVVKNEGTAKNATANTDFDGKSLVVSVLLDDIRNNGPVYRSMSTAQKSRR